MKELLNKVIKNTSKEEEKDLLVEFMKEIDINEKYFKEIKQNCSEDFDIFKEDFKKLLNSKIQINSEDLLGRVVLVGQQELVKLQLLQNLQEGLR